jgi:hypothetical protein
MHFTENDDLWESLDDPTIEWIMKQDETRFQIDQLYSYEYDTPRHGVHAEVYIEFIDQKLETEFLLKFDINNGRCSS